VEIVMCGTPRALLIGTYLIALGSVASAADITPVYYKAAPPDVFTPKIHIGLAIGGSWITDLPTRSSSGFYTGNTDTSGGLLIGGSAFIDIARFGNPAVLFGSWVFSVGVVVDAMNFSSLTWHGTCGGVACTGTGSLREINFVPELKAMTAITPRDKVGAYVGLGVSSLSPDGRPTGPGGPAFTSRDSAAVLAAGLEIDHQVGGGFSIGGKVGVRHIYQTQYTTTLPGEFFRFDSKTQMIAAITGTYTLDAP
jgi:hypothetical protein